MLKRCAWKNNSTKRIELGRSWFYCKKNRLSYYLCFLFKQKKTDNNQPNATVRQSRTDSAKMHLSAFASEQPANNNFVHAVFDWRPRLTCVRVGLNTCAKLVKSVIMTNCLMLGFLIYNSSAWLRYPDRAFKIIVNAYPSYEIRYVCLPVITHRRYRLLLLKVSPDAKLKASN